MKNVLFKLFKESRFVFFKGIAPAKTTGPAPSGRPGEAAPQVPSRARLDGARSRVTAGAMASRRGETIPDKYKKSGEASWDFLDTDEDNAKEHWAEDLVIKCKDLGELASEVLNNPQNHTTGFVAMAQKALERVQQIGAEIQKDLDPTTGEYILGGLATAGLAASAVALEVGTLGAATPLLVGAAAGAGGLGAGLGTLGFRTDVDMGVGQLNNRQAEMDEFESALKGESGSGATERVENTALLDVHDKAKDEDIPNLDNQVVDEANALKALLPKELGEKYSSDFYNYYKRECSPLIEKSKKALEGGMGAGKNVDIHKFIAEAQYYIDEADKLAGIYIGNIDAYHQALKPTLENEEYKGKFGKIVMGDFVKEGVKVFDKADKTKEGGLATESTALLEKYNPKFTIAVEIEKQMEDEGYKGANGKKLLEAYEKDAETLLKKTFKTPEELEKAAEQVIGTYAEKVKAAKELDDMKKGPDARKEKCKIVIDSAQKEFDTLKGKKKMTTDEAAQEVNRLIEGWKTKMELAKELDEMSLKREYSGKEGKEVLKKFMDELDPKLKNTCNDPEALRKDAETTFEKYEKDFRLAYVTDQLNNTYTLEDVRKALPQLNNPMVDPNSTTGKILKDVRKFPKIQEAAERYLQLMGLSSKPEPKVEPAPAAPTKKPAKRKTAKKAPDEQPNESTVSTSDYIKIGKDKYAAKAGKDEKDIIVYVDADGKTYVMSGKEYKPVGKLDTKAAQEKAKGHKDPEPKKAAKSCPVCPPCAAKPGEDQVCKAGDADKQEGDKAGVKADDKPEASTTGTAGTGTK